MRSLAPCSVQPNAATPQRRNAATPQRRNAATPPTSRAYRPDLLILEDRLSLGDGVLGLLVGSALLGPTQNLPALVQPAPQTTCEQSVATVAVEPARGWTPAALPSETLVSAFTDTAAATWSPWTDSFDAVTHPAQTPLGSPLREQGSNVTPLLTLRASEESAAPPVRGAAPAVAAPGTHTDATLLATLVSMSQPAAPARTGSLTPAQEAQAKESFGKLPLYFEQNVGQTDASVHFFTRGPGYGLYLTSTEAVMVLQPVGQVSEPAVGEFVGQDSDPVGEAWQDWNPAPQAVEAPPAVVRMQFAGANATPAVTGRDEQPGKINYFLGNDASKWHTNIATFGQVHYDEVYPGIDLVYYGTAQNQVEYDFVVSPGADPNAIRLNVSGADRLELDANGDLVVHAGGQQLRQHKPFVYQEVSGTRQEVASRFVLDEVASGVASAPRVQQVRFDVAAYDAGRPLVIDPVLSYSSYLGGRGSDTGMALAVEPTSGDVFLTGNTSSTNFPTVNPWQPALFGTQDNYVTRMRADGSALVWSTYLGGVLGEAFLGLTVDPATGDPVLAGWTRSTDFPTANAFQPNFGGVRDATLTRLRADGTALVYSTYLGGAQDDQAWEVEVARTNGDVLLAGYTASTNFPIANAWQPAYGGGTNDAFALRFRRDGTAPVWSTYLGGADNDQGNRVDVEPVSGDILLTGNTASSNFPTVSPFQPNYGGGTSDAFVTRFRADGTALIWSTYLGGSGEDIGRAIAVDPFTGDVVLAGSTASANFPIVNALQPANGGGSADAFVTRLRANGTALVWSTYLGGSGEDSTWALKVESVTGDVILGGRTASTNFPRANAMQSAFGGGTTDAFITRLHADGSALVYSSYLGGNGGNEYGRDIALDPVTGVVIYVGWTGSTNFPTSNPFQPAFGGGTDAFVSRISSSPVASFAVAPFYAEVAAGAPFDLAVVALDANEFVVPDYTGEVLIVSTDPKGVTPILYTFQRTDRGVAVFPGGVTLNTPGVHLLLVLDTATFGVLGLGIYVAA